jgi:hypothetical protein
MILQNNCDKLQHSFVKFKDDFLENAKEYEYLSCMININGSLVNSSLDLSKKDKKVLFSIKAYTSDFGQIPVKVACNLFDTLVKSILTYNSEISFMDSYLKLFSVTLYAETSNSEIDELNFIDKTAIEKVHLGFCKSTLGVKKSSTNLAVRAELGRLPLESFIKTQPSLYLLRLSNVNIKPLLKEAFHLSKILDKEGLYSWFTYAENIVSEIGFNILV